MAYNSYWGSVGITAPGGCHKHCPGVAFTIACTARHHRCGRLTLAPRAASAAEKPHSEGSRLPKLPPLRRIRNPAPASEMAADRQTPADVDQDLWEVLDLCTIEELEELHDILFGAAIIVQRYQVADVNAV
jgi:hypothetical protein